MLHGSPSPGTAGSELTRLLARWAEPAVAHPAPVFAERLGHWLSWTGAIALSAALAVRPAVAATAPQRSDAGGAGAELQRVQAALAAAIAAGPREPAASPTDFAPHRRHCLAQQQAMQDAIAPLRRRLRDAVARRSAAGARLAAIDAVMDDTLGPQERSLLALVPLRLQAQFERLQRQAADGDTAWTHTFRNDMAQVLLADLAHRLLPTRGLLAALHDDTLA